MSHLLIYILLGSVSLDVMSHSQFTEMLSYMKALYLQPNIVNRNFNINHNSRI